METIFFYGKDKLTVQIAVSLAKGKIKGILGEAEKQKTNNSRGYIQNMVTNGKTVYGVTTGFGILANTKIDENDASLLQYKILQSHRAGAGDDITPDIVRLMLITKIHSLFQVIIRRETCFFT